MRHFRFPVFPFHPLFPILWMRRRHHHRPMHHHPHHMGRHNMHNHRPR